MSHLSPIHRCKFVYGSPIIGALATTNGDCDYVSLKDWAGCVVVIMVDNATTVTGGDITLKQATAVAGTSEKALAFTLQYANTDAATSDTATATAVRILPRIRSTHYGVRYARSRRTHADPGRHGRRGETLVPSSRQTVRSGKLPREGTSDRRGFPGQVRYGTGGRFVVR